MGIDGSYYDEKAKVYHPKEVGKEVEILFVAESPPAPKDGEKPYFYNPDNQNENALWAQMKAALDIEAEDKGEFLSEFQNRGYFLIDLFPTHQDYKDFDEDQYSGKRAEFIERFSNKVSDSEPEKIVFICKRAAKLFSIPFPTKFSKRNQENFQGELEDLT